MAIRFNDELIELLHSLFAGHPDPVRLVGAGGEVLLRNEASRTLYPDGLGHLCTEERRGRDRSCPECQLGRVLREGTFMRWHVPVAPPGESDVRVFYELTLCPVRLKGDEVAGVVEVLRDDTASLGIQHFLIGESERQELEIEERAAEAGRLLEAADALRSELGEWKESQAEIVQRDRLVALARLVAGVAHEVHTPLGAILSSADLLERSIGRAREATAAAGTSSPGAVVENLDAMESATAVVAEGARRIERVVKTLRLFSRLDEAATKQVDLHEGIDSTIELLRYRLGDRIEVRREYGVLPLISCRPDALNQVFMNLLVNAIQAIPDKGEVRVRTRREGESVVVEISDTGVGIDEAELSRVFEAGFTTKKKGVGTGLGLAISRKIIGQHGGSIEVTTAPGEGSTFTVRLPV
jgi:signal transduction histidine kinase